MHPTDSTPLLSVDDLVSLIYQSVKALPSEKIHTLQSAQRVLASPATAAVDIPSYNNSAMDGYALNASQGYITSARIVGESRAGHVWSGILEHGEAIRISTGASIPQGADRVIMQEQIHIDSQDSTLIHFEALPEPQCNIRKQGEDIAYGHTLLTQGTLIGASQLNALIAAGITHVEVSRRPQAIVISSGDEIEDLPTLLPPRGSQDYELYRNKVLNSNGPAIAQRLREIGCEIHSSMLVRDAEGSMAKIIQNSLHDIDLIVSIGAVSVGPHDHIKQVAMSLGFTWLQWKIAMRPGKPIALGKRLTDDGKTQYWLALPGNPVSAMVCCELFAVPLIQTLLGMYPPPQRNIPSSHIYPHPHILARYEGNTFTKKASLRFFLRAQLRFIHGEAVVTMLDKQGSGQISSMAKANALLIIPEEKMTLLNGEKVMCMMLNS